MNTESSCFLPLSLHANEIGKVSECSQSVIQICAIRYVDPGILWFWRGEEGSQQDQQGKVDFYLSSESKMDLFGVHREKDHSAEDGLSGGGAQSYTRL